MLCLVMCYGEESGVRRLADWMGNHLLCTVSAGGGEGEGHLFVCVCVCVCLCACVPVCVCACVPHTCSMRDCTFVLYVHQSCALWIVGVK